VSSGCVVGLNEEPVSHGLAGLLPPVPHDAAQEFEVGGRKRPAINGELRPVKMPAPPSREMRPTAGTRPSRNVHELVSTGSIEPPTPLVVAGTLGERAIYAEVPSEPRNAHLFFGLFEVVSFVHSLHLLAGVLVWSWLLFANLRRRYSPVSAASACDSASLYWSLVALMRVALYPIFYLSQ
jgi:hypothetical protein